MKKYIFMAAAMLLAMASCTNEVEELNVAKKTVKLTATLSNGAETRATYTDNEGLKASWDATETITVLSLNASEG